MSSQSPQPSPEPARDSAVVDRLTDPRAISLLTTEHWSLLTARSLAYNEAFVRGGMFLTFLSMSLVALALLLQAMGAGSDFLAIAAIVLTFDLVIGLATFGRIAGANADDLRALHGMARIRHAYTEIAPIVAPYFTSATHDDTASVLTAYGSPPSGGLSDVIYGLTTSGGMIGLIVAMVGGVLAAVMGLLFGLTGGFPVLLGAGGAVLVFSGELAYALASIPREQARLVALFPAPPQSAGGESETA